MQNVPTKSLFSAVKKIVVFAAVLAIIAGGLPVPRIKTAGAAGTPPIIFFTDLIAGPNSGNSDSTYTSNGGAYVTIYGNFLDGYTSVKLNGASCLTVISGPTTWLWYERMTVQVGPTCATGNFSITTPNGTWNGPTVANPGWGRAGQPDFTVTSGVIRYVSPTGSDSAAGTFSSPWLNPYHAVQTLGTGAGNVIYVKDGSYGSHEDGQSWGASLTFRPDWSDGTAAQPNAIAAYPGTLPIIGCNTSGCPSFAVRVTDTDAWTVANRGYWTIAGLKFLSNVNGSVFSIAGGSLGSGTNSVGWRIIADDVSSPTGTDNTGTPFQIQEANNTQSLGNYVHDISMAATNRLDQAMYLSTDADEAELGWNEIYNSGGRGGIQTHSSNLCFPSCSGDQTGFILHDLMIHDNKIHHTNEEGMLIDTVDPSQGTGVRIFNNVIYDDNRDGNGDTLHLQLSGDYTQAGNFGHSPPPVWYYNNTVYTNGGEGAFGNWWPDVHNGGQTQQARAVNNLFVTSNSSVKYLDPENYSGQGCSNTDNATACPILSGNNNVMFGSGAPTFPSIFLNSLNVDPKFASPSTFDLHLQAGSPAVGAGLTTITDRTGGYSIPAPIYDVDGRVRPATPSIGAYEVSSGTLPPDTTAPTTPSGLTATAISSSQINLSWTASTDPDNSQGQISYAVYRNGVAVGTAGAGVTTYSDTGLSANTTYSYTVSASDPAGNSSSQSAGASATTNPPPDTTAPSVPSGLTATGTTTSTVSLSWTASTDPDNASGQIAYKVFRGGTQVGTTTAGTTSFVNTGLSASTTYTYTVSAFDPAGNSSAQSAGVSGTTQAGPLAAPVISSFTATPSSITSGQSATLSWTVSGNPSPTFSISGIGTVTGNSVSVSPTATTTYTLTATNSQGSATAQATVSVGPQGSSGPVALVQSASTFGSAVNHLAKAFTSNTTANNLLVVYFAQYCQGATQSISDSAGNAWTSDVTTGGIGGTGGSTMWSAIAKGGADTINVSTTCTSAGADLDIAEFSGGWATALPDRTASAVGTGSTPSTGLAAATTNASDLLVGAAYDLSRGGITWTAGHNGQGGTYVIGPTTNNSIDGESSMMEYLAVSNTAQYLASSSGASSGDSWLTSMSAFKQSGSGGGGGGGDTTPPTVSVTSPANNATVSSTVSVSATASDNVGVTRVEFYLDGVLAITDLTSPYAWSWNTASSTNGVHTLSAKAYDAAGNIGVSGNVSVTVSNSVVDTTPPSVPTGLGVTGTTTSTVALSWTASTDNVAVTGYKIFRNGTQIGTTAA
ncbi:MAG TPA: Ig-like domain-containing protein, partial [Candidatus Paceibacterota bacterium]|nr:Ig-like domain-containing protein [Candidatus Paceibacterota bacterium]